MDRMQLVNHQQVAPDRSARPYGAESPIGTYNVPKILSSADRAAVPCASINIDMSSLK